MRVKIKGTRTIFIGFDGDGNRVNGTGGDEFSVPKDLSKDSATRGLKQGILEAVKEVKKTATKAKRSTATKASKE